MKKKVMVGLVSVVVAVALVFGGVTFYNNRQQEKFEKQMASYESVDTMQHPSEATTSIDGIQVCLLYTSGKWMGLGVFGVWVAMTLDWVFRGILFVKRYIQGKWQRMALI